MKQSDVELGMHVRCTQNFESVPKGTLGVVDEVFHRRSVWVAWNLPNRPLPSGYRVLNEAAVQKHGIYRERFEIIELCFLESAGKAPEVKNPTRPRGDTPSSGAPELVNS